MGRFGVGVAGAECRASELVSLVFFVDYSL